MNKQKKIQMHNGKPEIIKGMKDKFLGKYYIEQCYSCNYCYGSGNLNLGHQTIDCPECKGEGHHNKKMYIDWALVKQIYQDTALYAVKSAEGD